MEWKKFDYSKPFSGVYWLITRSPEWDDDDDDYGHIFAVKAGTLPPTVRLCEIDYDGDGEFYVYRDIESQSDLELEDAILFYRDLEKPSIPSRYVNKKLKTELHRAAQIVADLRDGVDISLTGADRKLLPAFLDIVTPSAAKKEGLTLKKRAQSIGTIRHWFTGRGWQEGKLYFKQSFKPK